MNLLGLLGQYKLYILGIAILFLGVYFYGNYREDIGRDKLQSEIEKAPIVSRDTVTVHDTLRPPIQNMSGIGRRSRVILQEEKPTLDTDYCRELWNENQHLLVENSILREETGVTLNDSLGGTHEISYKPVDAQFNEKYVPPPIFTDRTTITNTKVVFEKHLLSFYPLVSYRDEASFGGLIGIDRVVFGGLFGKLQPQWIVGIKIEF